ncbi:hypothetical protein ACFLXG_03950 [Chloroflexota bacterium]
MYPYMCISLEQWALILQITGFSCSGIFAGIMLNKNVAGKIADKFSKLLRIAANKIDQISFKLEANSWLPTGRLRYAFLLYFLIIIVPIGLILVAIINKIHFLFWFALVLLSLFFISKFIIVLERYLPFIHKRVSKLKTYKLIPIKWNILIFLIEPIFTIFITCFLIIPSAILKLLALIGTKIAQGDNLQKIMIYLGAILLLSGLVLKLVISFQSTN